MRAVILSVCGAVLCAPSALAQQEGLEPTGDIVAAEEAPRGLLGLELPENQERQNALLLQNFLAMDENRDFIVARNEWESWSGWRGSPAPDFTSVDSNASAYLSYREYEDAALASDDSRMADAMHGAVFPETETSE